MWYHYNTATQQDELKIRWVGMSTTDDAVIMNVSAPWSDIGINRGADDKSCSPTPGENLKGNNVYVLDINYNKVKIQT
jgi:hypothetical protein